MRIVDGVRPITDREQYADLKEEEISWGHNGEQLSHSPWTALLVILLNGHVVSIITRGLWRNVELLLAVQNIAVDTIVDRVPVLVVGVLRSLAPAEDTQVSCRGD